MHVPVSMSVCLCLCVLGCYLSQATGFRLGSSVNCIRVNTIKKPDLSSICYISIPGKRRHPHSIPTTRVPCRHCTYPHKQTLWTPGHSWICLGKLCCSQTQCPVPCRKSERGGTQHLVAAGKALAGKAYPVAAGKAHPSAIQLLCMLQVFILKC